MQDDTWKQVVSPPPASPEPGPVDRGILWRVIAVFTAPGRAMDAVKAKPRWLIAGLIVMVVMAIFTVATMHIAGPEQVEMMKETRFGRMMTPEQLQVAQEQASNPSVARRVTSAISGAATGWIVLFVSGLVYLLFGKLAGGPGTFKQVMGVTFWAGLISFGLGTLVKLPLVFAKQSVMEVSTGLGLLAPGDPLSLSYQLLSILDLFSIWSVAVAVIGFEKIHRFARGKAVVVTVLPWLLMSFIMIGIGRIFL